MFKYTIIRKSKVREYTSTIDKLEKKIQDLKNALILAVEEKDKYAAHSHVEPKKKRRNDTSRSKTKGV